MPAAELAPMLRHDIAADDLTEIAHDLVIVAESLPGPALNPAAASALTSAAAALAALRHHAAALTAALQMVV
jgi:hypothetical protein